MPCHAERRQRNSVLLTVDLTKAVADEAIARRDSVVIAYREFCLVVVVLCMERGTDGLVDPIIFRGLKSLTLGDTQQQSLLRLAMEGISVYCPHTAVDAVPGGLGDWLANIVTNSVSDQQSEDSAKERIIPGSNYSSAKDSNQANNSRKNSSSCYRQYSGPSHPVFASDKGRQTSYDCLR